MAHRVCPPWIGYLMLNPMRRLMENPDRIFGPYVREGMTVLEPGCGTGFFTLPLARMVGESGRVVAVDIQERMLEVTRRRAEKAGLGGRVETILAGEEGLGIGRLAGACDLVVAMHMVHEVPDKAVFFREIFEALKPGGRMLMVEPKGHTSGSDYETFLHLAREAGLNVDRSEAGFAARRAMLAKGQALAA